MIPARKSVQRTQPRVELPNEETKRTLMKSRKGQGVKSFESLDEMLASDGRNLKLKRAHGKYREKGRRRYEW